MFVTSALTATAVSFTPMAYASGSGSSMAFSQYKWPGALKVPAAHKVAMETVRLSEITWQCRADKGIAGKYAWTFAGPDAKLLDRSGKQVGKYHGPPATWESLDSSKFDGKQLAVAPGGDGNIPFQLVQANPAMGSGALSGVSCAQRSATKGGVAPKSDCATGNVDAKVIVSYQADYVFKKGLLIWRAQRRRCLGQDHLQSLFWPGLCALQKRHPIRSSLSATTTCSKPALGDGAAL